MVLLKRKFWIFLQVASAFTFIILLTNSIDYKSDKKPLVVKLPRELKDWHDYELIRSDSLRVGYGEHGKGEKLTDANEIELSKKLFKEYGFNVLISDKVSVNRSIPEFRHPECYKKKYYKDLPKVSIVIIFVDEYFSVFKRTLHSLYNRTPHELVEEVILVNDHSTKEYLYEPLRIYVSDNFPDFKFKIINLKKRHGLMRARVVGAKAAKSEFLFITEPHCEMTYNWLPPLLQPLVDSIKVVTVPIIDNIEWKELEYYENDRGSKGSRGVFDWNLDYQKLPRLPVKDKSKDLDPFPIPVMTGGIYMIRKSYFFKIGPYDPDLVVWGAENIEMSLKINLCGGQLLEVPCSHIGHMFRAFTKSRRHESGIDFEGHNRKRVVEVWFDEYKKYVYERHQKRYDKITIGDLTEAKKFKDKLKCKPFKYFLTDVAPDLLQNFQLNQYPFATGQVKLIGEDLCFETDFQGDPEKEYEVYINKCYESVEVPQNFELSWNRDIRLKGMSVCIDAFNFTPVECHQMGGNQHFKYDIRTKQIISMNKQKCIEANLEDLTLKFEKCDENSSLQRWMFTEFVNETALNNWEQSGRSLKGTDGVYWS